MNSGREGLMAVREERVREGGIEKTSTTFVAATDEGLVYHLTCAAYFMLQLSQHLICFFISKPWYTSAVSYKVRCDNSTAF